MDAMVSGLRKLRRFFAAVAGLIATTAWLIGLVVIIDELVIDRPLRAAERIQSAACMIGIERACKELPDKGGVRQLVGAVLTAQQTSRYCGGFAMYRSKDGRCVSAKDKTD